MNIAIVDDGLFYRHDDLKNNVNTNRNYDYWSLEYDYPADVYQPFFVNHGTAVAGLIAAEHNEFGVRGVAPGATIYSYNYVDYAAYEGEDLRYEADAMTRNRATTQISSNSWGPSDDGLPTPLPQRLAGRDRDVAFGRGMAAVGPRTSGPLATGETPREETTTPTWTGTRTSMA